MKRWTRRHIWDSQPGHIGIEATERDHADALRQLYTPAVDRSISSEITRALPRPKWWPASGDQRDRRHELSLVLAKCQWLSYQEIIWAVLLR